jgi:hypothetical protein
MTNIVETHPGFQHPLFSGVMALIANYGADQVNAQRRSGNRSATAMHRNARPLIGRPEQAGGARAYFARDVGFAEANVDCVAERRALKGAKLS